MNARTPAVVSILVVLAILVPNAGCTEGSTSRPRRPGDDAGTVPGDDAGTPIDRPDTGPRPDGGPPRARDSDDDGLPDDDEIARGTDPHNADTDGDGYSDGVEVLAGTDPRSAASFIPPTDFYVVLPHGDPPVVRELDFAARLGRGDIFFLVDTTGSMGTAITNVRSSLSTMIVPAVQAAIADVVMGVGDYRDFPVDPYGDPGDWAFTMRQAMTPDVAAVQTALNALRAGGGNDGPESALEGLHGAAVGGSCPDGFGQACFRNDSHPIIVLVTDAEMHNGPGGANAYSGIAGAHTFTETVAALNARSVKVVGVAVDPAPFPFPIPVPLAARPHLLELARGTSSRSLSGAETVYDAPGGSVSRAVVDGIADLVGATTQDVDSATRDDPSDAEGVDARRFIQEVRPLRATRATRFDATTFYGVAGGTTITFQVTFGNDFFPARDHVTIFRAYIDVREVTTGTVLDTRNVYIVVPGEGGILI